VNVCYFCWLLVRTNIIKMDLQARIHVAILTLTIFAVCNVEVSQGLQIKIAALLPEAPKYLFSRRIVEPAIQYAIEYIQNSTNLIQGHELVVNYRDSNCSAALGKQEEFFFISSLRTHKAS